jgi:segregation and condensation protein B
MEELETQPDPQAVEHAETQPEPLAEASAEPDVPPEPAPESDPAEPEPPEALSVEELMASRDEALEAAPQSNEDAQLKAVLEAIVYVAEEPLTLAQISAALHEPAERIQALLDQLIAEFDAPGHGISIREVAGGYKMATKPEHHDAVREFVKSLNPPLKLSLPALETLAVIAYKQPVTGPEIQEIRGVQGGGVMKTLLDRKLIAHAGRKNVVGKPILYKTTKEFLIQFGLKDLSELPTLKEFEEIRRMAFSEDAPPATEAAAEQSVVEAAAEAPAEGAAPESAAAEAEPQQEPAPQAEAPIETPES